MGTNVVVIISILVVIGVALFFLRNTYFVKKYWAYLLILVPAIITILLKLSITKTKKKKEDLDNNIRDIKEDLQEAQQKAAIEVTAIRQKNKEKLNELKKVTKIADKKERLNRLAGMMKL